MSTKLDQKWANSIISGVQALALEVERLENLLDKKEQENRKLHDVVDVLRKYHWGDGSITRGKKLSKC